MASASYDVFISTIAFVQGLRPNSYHYEQFLILLNILVSCLFLPSNHKLFKFLCHIFFKKIRLSFIYSCSNDQGGGASSAFMLSGSALPRRHHQGLLSRTGTTRVCSPTPAPSGAALLCCPVRCRSLSPECCSWRGEESAPSSRGH